MENDNITITMSKEQYEDMIYCMNLVKKQRERASNFYYNKVKKNGGKIRGSKKDIQIPSVNISPSSS